MRASLCIPTHQITNAILETINNFFVSFSEDLEIVIVLDGGDRGALLDAFDFLGDSLKVLMLAESHGPAFARNLAAKNATGGVLIFVDSDVVVHPPVFKTLAQVKAGETLVPAVLPLGITTKASRFFSDFALAPKRKDGLTMTVSACFSLQREAFLNQGGFNENFKYPAGEDWEFFKRIQLNGLTISFDKNIRVFHMNPRSFIGVMRRSYRYAKYGAEIHETESNNQSQGMDEGRRSILVWFFLPEIFLIGGAKIVFNSLSIGDDFFEHACKRLQNRQEKVHRLISNLAYGSVKKSTEFMSFTDKVVNLSSAMKDFSIVTPWASVVETRNDFGDREKKSYRLLVLAWQLSYIFGYSRRDQSRES